MNAVVALFISIFLILVLIRFEITFAVLAGALFLALTTSPESFARTIESLETWRIIAIVILAFSIGYSMEVVGMLEKITKSVHSFSGENSVALIPLLIGLLPMPGGALVSAVMIKDLVKKFKINAEKAVFINYWFRHVWVTVWPLYPNIVIAMGILSTNYVEIVKSNYPIFISSLVSGLILFRMKRLSSKEKIDFSGLAQLYPIMIITALSFLTKSLLISLTAAFLSIIILNRAYDKVRKIFSKTIDLKIIILVFAVMLYKNAIQLSNSSQLFYDEIASISNPMVAAFLLSFLIAFATGIELSYTSIALPLLTSFTGIGNVIEKHLMVIFLGGILGVMLSPMHLCLILTAQYFKGNLYKVYRYLIPSALITLSLSLLLLKIL